MRDPKIIEADGKEYTISKMPAFQAQQFLLLGTANVAVSIIFPKFGHDWKTTAAEYCLAIMKYVYVDIGGTKVSLNSQNLIDNHVMSLKTLLKLQAEVVAHTVDFSDPDLISGFLNDFVQTLKSKATEALTTSSGQL